MQGPSLGSIPPAAHAAIIDAPHPALDRPLTRIAFGSCAKQSKEQPIWDAINAAEPDLFVFLGDNIYADTRDPKVMADKISLAMKTGAGATSASAVAFTAPIVSTTRPKSPTPTASRLFTGMMTRVPASTRRPRSSVVVFLKSQPCRPAASISSSGPDEKLANGSTATDCAATARAATATAGLGQDTLDYVGFSYGTWIGAVYGATHPDRVGRFVLDGVVAPQTTRDVALQGQTEAQTAFGIMLASGAAGVKAPCRFPLNGC